MSRFLLTLFLATQSIVAMASPLDALFAPDSPGGLLLEFEDKMTLPFCAKWDPEFAYRGGACCHVIPKATSRRGRPIGRCAPNRGRATRCDEMTAEQRRYREHMLQTNGKDALDLLTASAEVSSKQSFCSVKDGFLVNGREIIESPYNRLVIRSSSRCINFGTDRLIATLEWVGRRVADAYSDPKYSGVRLLLGDLTGPRGGCVTGQSGRRGHSSHANGLDADIGFFTPRQGNIWPELFSSTFDPATNWWMLKQIFQNPFACVKVVFVDRRHIAKMAKVAAHDPLWPEYRRFIRHIRGHRGHFHLRVGEWPGAPGCQGDPETEEGDDTEAGDSEGGPDSASDAASDVTEE